MGDRPWGRRKASQGLPGPPEQSAPHLDMRGAARRCRQAPSDSEPARVSGFPEKAKASGDRGTGKVPGCQGKAHRLMAPGMAASDPGGYLVERKTRLDRGPAETTVRHSRRAARAHRRVDRPPNRSLPAVGREVDQKVFPGPGRIARRRNWRGIGKPAAPSVGGWPEVVNQAAESGRPCGKYSARRRWAPSARRRFGSEERSARLCPARCADRWPAPANESGVRYPALADRDGGRSAVLSGGHCLALPDQSGGSGLGFVR